MNQRSTQTEFASLKSEHASLDREIADWRTWWRELNEMGQPHFGEMGDRLAQFRAHLAAHFAHEEGQRGLSLVAELPPDSVKRLAELRDEHSGLMEELDRLIHRLQTGEPDFDCWGGARREFEAFLARLNAHEEAEEAVLSRSA